MMEISDDESNNPVDEDHMEDDEMARSNEELNCETQDGALLGDEILSDVTTFIEQLVDVFDRDDAAEARDKLKKYLAWAVPFSYKPKKNVAPLGKQQPLDGTSEIAKAVLFPVLDSFLDDKHQLTTYLQTLAVSRPSLCGRVFKVGEPTYSCRDCGMDPTCVLCSTCFKQSGHRGHRYKISTSSGGGYCDCGDEEAWKSDKYCDAHQPVVTHDRDDRSLRPVELEDRVRFLLEFMLKYTYKLLIFELTLSVPSDLDIKEEDIARCSPPIKRILEDDVYCTVLYNDETHTFDTVINTLQRALECQQREAIDYATMIDREGRCVVKIDAFQQCYQAKQIIERYTSRNGAKPLKVTVMQSHVVAHQIFALKALEWIENLLEKSGAFRDIFADLVETLLDQSTNRSMLEGIMLNDTKLWKTARTTWHHVVIAAMLKDYELKKRFATYFSRNYAETMKDFISDDHDHPYSITSLSVQIFTVPTIAHYLIEDHDVIFAIMRTLMSEYGEKLNSGMKLNPELLSNQFLGALEYYIEDLKYILTIPPTIWTDGLIKNFNRGMDYFLQLLCAMQEMDNVTRQTGNHMEYEPEWESAFNLQIKIQPALTLALEWLATNKTIFIRAFRYCLRELAKEYNNQTSKTSSKEFANHAANCFVYDVATEPVSVHLPLSRFFAGLYVYLEQYNLEFVSPEFQIPDKPVPAILMEPCLRTQVLLAQVHAGMWKRNGYSLLNQLYFYQNVRCRTDMMDKDIMGLQIGASLIEANEFLLHVINRFDLFQWADTTFYDRYLSNVEDDLYKHLSTLVSELLGLVINIFSARYVPGVGQVTREDCIKKEIIQLLCIEPMTHSVLSKGLVENVNGETGLESVIVEVAVFKKSNTAGQGHVYELKPEFYKEYDWHHYHYTREEMSRAEEKQRERKKTAKEPEFFPPPTLPPFTSSFNLVVNILKSDVLLQMLSLVLQRCMKKPKNFNDSHLRKALHLIGHGLNEEIARNEKEVDQFFQFCEACKRWKIFDLLDNLLKEPNLAQHHDMIMWLRKQKSKIRPRSDNVVVAVETEEDVPMVQPDEEEEKQKKARLAAETRAKVLAKMVAAQQKFMAVNADLFTADDGEDNVMPEDKELDTVLVKSVAIGPCQTPVRQDDESYICILCKEEHALSITSKRFVLASFIQRSSVLCDTREELREKELKKSTDFLESSDIFIRRNLLLMPHVSSCGHIMHEACWAAHIDGVVTKERRRPYRHPQSFDVDRLEWLCPMCDCICNAALPMSLPLHKLYSSSEDLIADYVAQTLKPVVVFAEDKGDCSLFNDVNLEATPSQLKPSEACQDLCNRAKKCFSPEDKQSAVKGDTPMERPLNPSLNFLVWISGMDILETVAVKRLTNTHGTERPGSPPPPMSSEFLQQFLKNLNQMVLPPLLTRLYERGLPGARFLENLHGHMPSEHVDTASWLHAKFFDKLLTFMERVFVVATDKTYHESDRNAGRLHRSLWHSLAYTIMSAEAYHRDQSISFFGENVPIRRSIGLKFLTRACSVSIDSQFFSHFAELHDEFMRLVAVLWNVDSNSPCVMEIDAFGLLILLTYLTPFALYHSYSSVVHKVPKSSRSTPESEDEGENLDELVCMTIRPPMGSDKDHHNLRLAFTVQVFQIIVSLENLEDFASPLQRSDCDLTANANCTSSTSELNNGDGVLSEDVLRLLICEIWAKARHKCEADTDFGFSNNGVGYAHVRANLDCDKVWKEVSKRSVPFLRCCAKFFESMTGISPPPALEKVESCFEDLVGYLDLPTTMKELFDLPEITELMLRWSEHPSMYITVTPKEANECSDSNLKSLHKLSIPRSLRPLVDLPMDYTDLINSVSLFKCVKCDPHDSRMPTMCLICGEILCSQSYCCQQELKKENMGACTYHAYFCGGGIGIFLRIRECRLFLLSGRNKGCHMLPPYLDEYGETDQGLRRGNPMTLSLEKYEHFRRLWIQHAIPEEIARITEHHNSLPTTEWVYL